MQKKLLLVDGHSLAYRAFHALPVDLKSPSGELTNASFGFTMMLTTVLEQEDPDYVVVTFDKGPSFRLREYAEYKAHRERMPAEMRSQMERIRELVAAFGIPIVELEDFEADDLLGTLSLQAANAGVDVVIVTGDRDALQLVDDRVTVVTSGRRFSDTLRYTPEAVRERYSLDPSQLVDLKALVGDKSDNIPGVSGVGEKGAAGLLQAYGSLDGLYAHLEEIPQRYRDALVRDRDVAYLSQRLGRIVRDAPVKLDLDAALRGHGLDRERLLALMHDLGFRTLVSRLHLAMPAPAGVGATGQLSLFAGEPEAPVAPSLGAYRLVKNNSELHELAARLSRAPAIALDTETTGIDPMTAELVGISLTDVAGEAWYIPVRAPAGDASLELQTVRRELGSLLADPSIEKRGHNLKYDIKVLLRHGLPVRGRLFDTMVAEWVLNPDSPNLGLKAQSFARLGIRMTEITELIGQGANQLTIDQVPLSQVVAYAGADADMTYRLAELLAVELRDRAQDALFAEIEMPLLPVLVDMEVQGIKLDLDWLSALSRELEQRLHDLEQEVYRHAGSSFNLNSTQQLSEVLFERLGLSARGVSKTKSGHYSTRAEVLEGLRGAHPVVDGILAYRELAKLKSTYVDALPQLVDRATGRVHTSYNPTGAVTGRISSTNPNLQNIPIRSEEGRRVRRAFVAEEGWALIGADYSQVELRVAAHMSQDPGLLGAFARGEDIHATTAAAVYGVPLSAVTSDMRRIAKAVNFGLLYGQGAYGLARQLSISVGDAQAFVDRYFERFPNVRAYMERVQLDVAQNGYVETLLKRRRYFPELAPGSTVGVQERQAAQRMAINTPIQGSAADIIKLAMIRVHRRLAESGLNARMLLQVHDEIVLEAPRDEVEPTAALLRAEMEGAFELAAPLKVDIETGRSWDDMG